MQQQSITHPDGRIETFTVRNILEEYQEMKAAETSGKKPPVTPPDGGEGSNDTPDV